MQKRLHFGYQIGGSGVTILEIFESADRVGTDPQTIINRERESASVSVATLHKGISGGTTDGTRIVWRKEGRSTGGALGATIGTSLERILKRNTKYLLRLTSGSAGNDISIEWDWYEHTSLA